MSNLDEKQLLEKEEELLSHVKQWKKHEVKAVKVKETKAEHDAMLKEVEAVKHKLVAKSYSTHGPDIGTLYDNIDTDRSGQIEMGELSIEVKKLVPDISRKELKFFLRAADSDGGGTLDKNEFIEFLTGCGKEKQKSSPSPTPPPHYQNYSPVTTPNSPLIRQAMNVPFSPDDRSIQSMSNVGDASGQEFLNACFMDLEYAKLLVESNKFFDVNWNDRNGNSLLHILAYKDHAEAMQLLLLHGANPNFLNANKETPIHWATKMRSMRCLSLLVTNGGDVCIQDKSGSTALHYSASKGIPEAVPFLLLHQDNQAQCILDNDGHTPLDLAMHQNDDDYRAVAHLLEKHTELERNRSEENDALVMMMTNEDPSLTTDRDSNNSNYKELSLYKQDGDVSVQVDEDMLAASASESGILTRLDSLNDMRQKKSFSEYEKKITGSRSGSTADLFSPPTNISSKTFYDSMKSQLSTKSMDTIGRLRSAKKSLVGFWSGVPRVGPYPEEGENDKSAKWMVDRDGEVVHYAEPEPPGKPLVLYIDKASLLPREHVEVNDLFLVVEHCADCHLHKSSLWHSESKYQSTADSILNCITKYVLDEGFPVRLFAFKVKMEASRFRYGALEASLGFWSGEEWISGSIHSKLVSKSWPSMSKLRKKTESFICEMITETNSATFLKNPRNPKICYSLGEYESWKERMWGTSPEQLKKAQLELKAHMAVHGTGDFDASTTAMTAPADNGMETIEVKRIDEETGEEIVENNTRLKPKPKIKKRAEPVIGKPYFDIGLLQTELGYRQEAAKHFYVFDHTEVKKRSSSNKFQ